MVTEKVRRYIKDNNIDIKELAKEANVSYAKLKAICGQEAYDMDVITYYRLCKCWGVSLNFF